MSSFTTATATEERVTNDLSSLIQTLNSMMASKTPQEKELINVRLNKAMMMSGITVEQGHLEKTIRQIIKDNRPPCVNRTINDEVWKDAVDWLLKDENSEHEWVIADYFKPPKGAWVFIVERRPRNPAGPALLTYFVGEEIGEFPNIQHCDSLGRNQDIFNLVKDRKPCSEGRLV